MELRFLSTTDTPSTSALRLHASSHAHSLLPSSRSLLLHSPPYARPLLRNSRCLLRFGSSAGVRKRVGLTYSSAGVLPVEKNEVDPFPEGVKVTLTKMPQSCVKLNVQVPPVILQDCYRDVLDTFAKQMKVSGFRNWKSIPEKNILNYVGNEQVQRATLESILQRTLPNAMSSVKELTLKDSLRIVTKFEEMKEKFSLEDIFRYDVVTDVVPEVKWLPGDGYKNLKIVVEIDNDITPERAAEIELQRRHKALGSLKIVTERGLQVGDLVVLDIFATTINEDDSVGANIPSAERQGFHFDTEGRDNLLPGFFDAIVGIKQGETRSFQLLFPDTWEQENLRGIRAQFKVECKELFYRDLPELNDSVAGMLLPGCDTLIQVQESILERCREVEKTAIEQATDNAILDQLSKIVDVDVPNSLIEEQGRYLYGDRLLQLQANKKIDENQLASLSSAKAVNEYIQSQKESITKIVKQMLAVSEIFRCENLSYSTAKLVQEIENSTAEFKRHNQEYDEDRVKQQVQDILEAAEVLEWLKERADVQYVKN